MFLIFLTWRFKNVTSGSLKDFISDYYSDTLEIECVYFRNSPE